MKRAFVMIVILLFMSIPAAYAGWTKDFIRGTEDTLIDIARGQEDRNKPVKGMDRLKRVIERRTEDFERWLNRKAEDWAR